MYDSKRCDNFTADFSLYFIRFFLSVIALSSPAYRSVNTNQGEASIRVPLLLLVLPMLLDVVETQREDL